MAKLVFCLPICFGLVTVSCSTPKVEVRSSSSTSQLTGTPSQLLSQARGHFKLRNFALASEGFRKAIRQDPNSVEALNGLAACYDQMGRFDLSRRYYELALALSPQDPKVLHNLALSDRLQGKVENEVQIGWASSGASKLPERAQAASAFPEAGQSALRVVQAETQLADAQTINSTTKLRIERVSLGEVLITARPTSVAQQMDSAVRGPVRRAELIRQESGMLSFRFPAAANALSATPLRVLNAVGRKGQAGRMQGYLASKGWQSSTVADAERRRSTSLMLYPPRLAGAAKALTKELPFQVSVAPSPHVRQIVLLIGSNAVSFDEQLLRKI